MSYTWAFVVISALVFSNPMSANSPGTLDATQPLHPFDPSGTRTDSASRSQENDLTPFNVPESVSTEQPSAPSPPMDTIPPRRKTENE